LPVELRSKPLHERPAAAQEVGTLVVQTTPTCSIEVRDAGGAVKATHGCTSLDDKTMDLLNALECDLGGEVSWVDASATAAHAEVHVGRYAKHDEAADLALICAPFATVAEHSRLHVQSPDPSQKAAIRGDILEGSLTSPRWRRWLHELHRGGHLNDSALPPLREASQTSHIACEAEWLAPAEARSVGSASP
jgi:hypothetical protein